MNKIGIITFHASHNTGSMLQAFALQTILEKDFNAKSDIIDYSNEGQQAMYRPFWKVTDIKSLIKNALWLTVLPQIKRQRETYINFSNKYFRLSDLTFQNNNELRSRNLGYDKYITGSDQVWNVCCLDADDAYYLDFVKEGDKYAYAVSFGANNPFIISDKKEHYLKLISDFKRISVRENNAQKWILNANGKQVPMCLDPTMLLSQNEWERYIDLGDKPIIQGEYIFYYCFSISQDIAKFLHEISNKMGIPVYFSDPKEWALRCCWKNKIHLVDNFGPEAFLNYFKYATLIFTTSFHGTAFSTIFHKNFWYIDSGKNDLSKDDRAVSFLTQLGLISRYKKIEDLKNIDLNKNPNYTMVDSKLNDLIKNSKQYLQEIIND